MIGTLFKNKGGRVQEGDIMWVQYEISDFTFSVSKSRKEVKSSGVRWFRVLRGKVNKCTKGCHIQKLTTGIGIA